jgi:hypothetical protein
VHLLLLQSIRKSMQSEVVSFFWLLLFLFTDKSDGRGGVIIVFFPKT